VLVNYSSRYNVIELISPPVPRENKYKKRLHIAIETAAAGGRVVKTRYTEANSQCNADFGIHYFVFFKYFSFRKLFDNN